MPTDPIMAERIRRSGPVGPTNISDTAMVFASRSLRAGILTRDRWIGRRLKWHVEWKKPDLWIGVFWRAHHGESYGIRFVYAREIWICVLPCLPICVTTYGHDARPIDQAAIPQPGGGSLWEEIVICPRCGGQRIRWEWLVASKIGEVFVYERRRLACWKCRGTGKVRSNV